jgi:para-nitrobenzyl esterase
MRQQKDSKINRRTLFARGAVLTGGAATGSLIETGCTSGTAASSGPSGPMIVVSDRNAVVETAAGKVRGFTRNGIHTFKGIPYAASTAGSGRFVSPAKPKPWAGIRSSTYYGPTCPQAPRMGWLDDENAFLFQWDDGQPGEDCLRVNLWTPGLNDGKKRPVMVWLHGGGWAAGSGQEQPAYNGENLSGVATS